MDVLSRNNKNIHLSVCRVQELNRSRKRSLRQEAVVKTRENDEQEKTSKVYYPKNKFFVAQF